jgi:hypothetical protein
MNIGVLSFAQVSGGRQNPVGSNAFLVDFGGLPATGLFINKVIITDFPAARESVTIDPRYAIIPGIRARR